MGSRHCRPSWTLQDLKWNCNNHRCQVVASLPGLQSQNVANMGGTKEAGAEQSSARCTDDALPSLDAILGHASCTGFWLHFYPPSQTGTMCMDESTSRCADSLSKPSLNPGRDARTFSTIERQQSRWCILWCNDYASPFFGCNFDVSSIHLGSCHTFFALDTFLLLYSLHICPNSLDSFCLMSSSSSSSSIPSLKYLLYKKIANLSQSRLRDRQPALEFVEPWKKHKSVNIAKIRQSTMGFCASVPVRGSTSR